jgi:hypothetical protein
VIKKIPAGSYGVKGDDLVCARRRILPDTTNHQWTLRQLGLNSQEEKELKMKAETRVDSLNKDIKNGARKIYKLTTKVMYLNGSNLTEIKNELAIVSQKAAELEKALSELIAQVIEEE